MKFQRTFICIAGVLFAVGFAASQATAGTGTQGCDIDGVPMTIEVNALRAGGKTVVTTRNDTTRTTAKARILKGTAPKGTTIVTTLTIRALDGGVIIGEEIQKNITLGVGKGGKGATLSVATTQCNSGFITFTAEFRGEDADGEDCIGEREIRKECR